MEEDARDPDIRTTGGARRVPRWLRAWLAVGVAVLTVWVSASHIAPVSSRIDAAWFVAEVLDLIDERPFAPEVAVTVERPGGVTVDAYRTAGANEAVLLVPGAAPGGRADPRVVDLAQSLARSGRDVFVPELEVYGETLVAEDVERIVSAVLGLEDRHGPVVLVGISFGGSLSLIAAADPRPQVPLVATFGAYADLMEVATAAIVGTSLVDGREIVWDADPRAGEVVGEQLLAMLPTEGRGLVRDVLAERLPADVLPDELRSVHAFLTATDHDEASAAIARMPEDLRSRLDGLSPMSVADEVGAEVVALHARDDPVIPYGELVRLGTAFEDAELLTVRGFGHTGFESPGGVRDALRDLRQVWRFATRVLTAG